MELTLNEIFKKSDKKPLHPRVRSWQARLNEAGTTATVEVFRPKSSFGQVQDEINVQFVKDGHLLPLESMPWDDDLNDGLIDLKVKSADPTREAERFALGLRAAMRAPVRDFGDGYFNSVLVELLKESDLARSREISDVLKHVASNSPHREGKVRNAYTQCGDMILYAISGRARELTETLGYSREAAEQILTAALGLYLDDRFTVSRRRRLGLL